MSVARCHERYPTRQTCVWCGRRTSSPRYKSCGAHRDLELALRAYYNGTMHADPQAREGAGSC